MGRVVKPLVAVEVVFLVIAFAVGLMVIIPLLQTQDQIPDVKCLPYASITYDHNPPHLWAYDMSITPPDANGTCNYCLFAQISVAVCALVCVIYRLVTLCAPTIDLSFLRTLSVPLFAMCTLTVLVEAIILQVGVNKFLGMLMEYDTRTNPHTCDYIQAQLQELGKSEKLDLNFCTEFQVATWASWISVLLWAILTVLTGIQFHLQRTAPEGDRQMLVISGSGAEEQKKY